MYHYKIEILILSQNDFLYNAVRSMPPLEGFAHQVLLQKDADEAIKSADIIICELVDADVLQALQQAKTGAEVILCAPAALMQQLPAKTYQFLTDIWAQPYGEAFVVFKLKRLFEAIKTVKDRNLYRSYLETAINSIPNLIWFKDVRGAHLKVNDGFCRAVGKTKADVEGRGHYYIWDIKQEEYEQGEYVCLETEEIVLQKRKTCVFDEKVKTKHGMRQLKTYKSPIFDDEHQLIGTVGIAQDVTDMENMGAELEVILRNLPFAVLLTNEAGIIINANENCSQYFSVDRETLLGQEYASWKHKNLFDMGEINAKGYADATLFVNGRARNMEIYEQPIYDVFGTAVGVLCMCRDVTVERSLSKRILHNANTDHLTELYNRRHFYEYMGKLKNMVQQVNLFYIDLDNFKKINDIHGHQTGDIALIMVADVLRETFCESFIVRIGGDEFLAVVLGPRNESELAELAERFLTNLQRAIGRNEKFAVLSASLGIAASEQLADVDLLIRQSDIALYDAKRHGKNQYKIYQP